MSHRVQSMRSACVAVILAAAVQSPAQVEDCATVVEPADLMVLQFDAVDGAEWYEVFLSLDAVRAVSATPDDPEFLGNFSFPEIELSRENIRPGRLHFLRVDARAADLTVKGTVRPICVLPAPLPVKFGEEVAESFGEAVAIAAPGLVAAGDPEFGADDVPFRSGRLTIFEETGQGGLGGAVLIQPDGLGVEDFFGAALAGFGDRFVAGSTWNDALGDDAGAAFVVQRTSGGDWSIERLETPGLLSFSSFGRSVATYGSFVAAGAPTYGILNGQSSMGRVYVYRFDYASGTWAVDQVLSETDTPPGGRYGESIALTDTVLVVGAPESPEGAAYIYERARGSLRWQRKARVTAGSRMFGQFGSEVAVSGDVVMVSAPSSEDGVFVFRKRNGVWRADGMLDDENTNMGFGHRLALSPGLMAVAGYEPGEVTLFYPHGASWLRAWLRRDEISERPSVDLGHGLLLVGSPMLLTPAVLPYEAAASAPALPSFESQPPVSATRGMHYAYTVRGALGGGLLQLSASGLPSWLSLEATSEGVWLLSGIPPASAIGEFPIELLLSNSEGGTASQVFVIAVSATADPPVILRPPSAATVYPGFRVVFRVDATGRGPLRYSWYKDGQFLREGTANSLVLEEVSEADEGRYSVTVSNEDGFAASGPATLTVLPPTVRGGDWPAPGRDAARTGYYPAQYGSHYEFVWSKIFPLELTPPVISEGRLFVAMPGQSIQSTVLVAYELASGAELWRREDLRGDGSVSPLSVDSGRVCLQRLGDMGLSEVQSFDAATGATLWRTLFPSMELRFGSPVSSNGRLWGAGYGGAGLFSLDPGIGEVLTFEDVSHSDFWAPVIGQGSVFSYRFGVLRRHDPQTGEMTGILEVNTAVEENPMPVISGSMAILSGNRMLAGVDTSTMREVWRVPGLFRETPAVVNDIVYVLSLGELVRVELATGEPIPGSFSPPLGFPLGQPVVSNDRVFLTTVSGDPTYVLKRSDLTLVETLPEGGAVSLCDGYVAITGWKDGIHQVSVYAVNRPPGFLEAPGQQAIAGNYYHSLIRVESGGDGTVEPAAIHLHDGPDWLSLEDFGDGTASLTGMPPIAAAGDYPYSIEIVPQNGAPARRFLVLTVVPGSGSVPVGEIYRILTRRDGSVIIEFSAEEGEHIDLEYSDDLRQWKRSPESFEPGNPRTFRDSGPPVTESHPASAATRYYRAVRVEP